MKKKLNGLCIENVYHYILAFSAIVILIIGSLGGYLYRFYYRTIYNDFLSSNKIYLSAFADRHENEMQIVNDIVLQMSLSGEVTEFKFIEQPLRNIKLKERLYQYITVNQFFNHLFYLYHNDEYMFTHKTSVKVDNFLDQGMILGNTSEEELRSLLYSNENSMVILPEQAVSGDFVSRYMGKVDNIVLFFLPVIPKRTGTFMFVVKDSYYDVLLDSVAEDLRENYIIYNGQVVVKRGALDLDETELLAGISGSGEVQREVRLSGKKYLLSIRNGENGLVYATVQSMEIFQDKILTQQWGILFFLLLCSIPASMGIVLLSKILIKRIKNINLLLNNDEEYYYNLSQIESGIQAIMESSRKIEEESSSLRRTKFIINFIRGDFVDRKAVIDSASLASLKVDYRYFLVILMRERGNGNETKTHELMLETLRKGEHADGYGMNLISNNQSLFVVFSDEEAHILGITDTIFHIGRDHCEDFIMSISAVHTDFEEASQAYLEADAAFDNRFLMDNSSIIRFWDIADKKRVAVLPEVYLQRLKNAIRTKEEEEIIQIIGEICDNLRKENHTLLTFRLLYNDIIHMLVTEWNMDDTDFRNVYNVFMLSQCLTMQDFTDILCEVCRALMSNRPSKGKMDKKSDLVSEAIFYIKKNFQDADLNMGMLAEYLKISSVTLAVEFKNVMGMGPSEYLAIIRMEKAKELLRDTNMKVKEISNEVGYEDDHVFMKRFKKYVGKTPLQYRKEG